MTEVTEVCIRDAGAADLLAINQVIEAAVMSWQLPERVKRLSLPSYYYDEADLLHLTLLVAEDEAIGIIAVAAWDEADKVDVPVNKTGLLLHGLYVSPVNHRKGVGWQLLSRTERHAADVSCDGVLVKAQTEAISFFQHQGYQALPVEDSSRHYSNRLWKPVASHLSA